MSTRDPSLRFLMPPGNTTVSAVVLVLNGGRANSAAPATRRNLAYQRMRFFARAVHQDLDGRGVAVWRLPPRAHVLAYGRLP